VKLKKEDEKRRKAEFEVKKEGIMKRKRQGLISSSDEAELLDRLEVEYDDASDGGGRGDGE